MKGDFSKPCNKTNIEQIKETLSSKEMRKGPGAMSREASKCNGGYLEISLVIWQTGTSIEEEIGARRSQRIKKK
jgi:hypothetical protein